jgi:hypothetical protein
MIARVVAVEYIRRMRGGSQAHLLRCSDGEYYVVKFQDNPQGTRTLVNEALAGVLAGRLGLPTPATAIVEVNSLFIKSTEDLVIHLGRGRVGCRPGQCFGSRYPSEAGPSGGRVLLPVYGFLPEIPASHVANTADFAGMLVFDKWTCNMDWRQVIFSRPTGTQDFRATMIDNGFCFNGGEWDFPSVPLRGLCGRPAAYEAVRGIDSFEPWLQILDNTTGVHLLDQLADDIPPEWYARDMKPLIDLLAELENRRQHVRALLWTTRSRLPQCFPNWGLKPSVIPHLPQQLERQATAGIV